MSLIVKFSLLIPRISLFENKLGNKPDVFSNVLIVLSSRILLETCKARLNIFENVHEMLNSHNSFLKISIAFSYVFVVVMTKLNIWVA